MTKSQLLSELERLKGDPEIAVRIKLKNNADWNPAVKRGEAHGILDRINEFPSPEIIIIEK